MTLFKDENPSYWQENAIEKITSCLNREDTHVDRRLDSNNWTMLHGYASHNDDLAIINKLLDAGANINVRDNSGFTPLHLAVFSNQNPEIIKLLLEKEADVYACNVDGFTALHFAAMRQDRHAPEIIMALIDKHADGTLRDVLGKIPFDYATENKFVKNTDAYWELREFYWDLQQSKITPYIPPLDRILKK